MEAPPLPRVQRPRFAECPPAQPGMIVTIEPPKEQIGERPFSSLVVCVTVEAIWVVTPGAIGPIRRDRWPFPQLLAVRSPLGELLWQRDAVVEHH